MIHKIDDGFIVMCDVCGGLMDEDGRTDGDAAVFCDKGDAGVFICDYRWDRIGDYVVCPDCVERINRREVALMFVKQEGAKK